MEKDSPIGNLLLTVRSCPYTSHTVSTSNEQEQNISLSPIGIPTPTPIRPLRLQIRLPTRIERSLRITLVIMPCRHIKVIASAGFLQLIQNRSLLSGARGIAARDLEIWELLLGCWIEELEKVFGLIRGAKGSANVLDNGEYGRIGQLDPYETPRGSHRSRNNLSPISLTYLVSIREH